MISTLGSYSDKVSDISSGSIYGSYILTFFLAYTMILSDMFSWHSIWHLFWQSIWHLFYSDIFSGMCSGPATSWACDMARFRACPDSTGARDELLALDTYMLGERRGGLAPLMKSRDPHLAGARLGPGKTPKTGNLHGFKTEELYFISELVYLVAEKSLGGWKQLGSLDPVCKRKRKLQRSGWTFHLVIASYCIPLKKGYLIHIPSIYAA